MLWAVHVALLAAAAATADQRGSAKPKGASAGWIESLRRQLMQDNYDYLASSSESAAETSPSKDKATTFVELMRRAGTTQYSSPKYAPPQYAPAQEEELEEHVVETASTRHDMIYYEWMDGLSRRRKNEVLKPNTRNVSILQPAHIAVPDVTKQPVVTKQQIVTKQQVVTKQRVVTRQGVVTEQRVFTKQPFVTKQQAATKQPIVIKQLVVTEQQIVTEPTPNVTLKLIRLSAPSRRGGMGPRFVAEAGARGVALASVDGAPFPEFRLPPDLRQYAHHHSFDLF